MPRIVKADEKRKTPRIVKAEDRRKKIVPQQFFYKGDPGEPGKDGRDGIDGRDGRDGRDGADGKGITWRGPWSSKETYKVQDAVFYFGSSFICVKENRNQIPRKQSPYWDLMAEAGATGSPGPALDNKVNGTTTITVGTTPPSSPSIGDLWVDTN